MSFLNMIKNAALLREVAYVNDIFFNIKNAAIDRRQKNPLPLICEFCVFY